MRRVPVGRLPGTPGQRCRTGRVTRLSYPCAVSSTRRLRGLIIDWGGVLTPSLDGAMEQWAAAEGVDFEHFRDVILAWVGRRGLQDTGIPDAAEAPVASLEQASDAGVAGSSPVHLLERGELRPQDFERALAQELAKRGSPVEPEGLLNRLLSGLRGLDPTMLDLVRRARAAGLRTALLSNSWGDHYPKELWDDLFDAVVISGRVGMRKPDPRIFVYVAEQLGLTPAECVMVDDLPHNVRGAVAAGMVAVRHTDAPTTMAELEALFELPLHG